MEAIEEGLKDVSEGFIVKEIGWLGIARVASRNL